LSIRSQRANAEKRTCRIQTDKGAKHIDTITVDVEKQVVSFQVHNGHENIVRPYFIKTDVFVFVDKLYPN
jgi:hypothetical protein